MALNTDLIQNLISQSPTQKFSDIQKTIAISMALDLRTPFFLAIPILGAIKKILKDLSDSTDALIYLLRREVLEVQDTLDTQKLGASVANLHPATIDKFLARSVKTLRKFQNRDSVSPEAFQKEYLELQETLQAKSLELDAAYLQLTELATQVSYIPLDTVQKAAQQGALKVISEWKSTSSVHDLATALTTLKVLWDRCLLDRSLDPLYTDQTHTFTWESSQKTDYISQGGPFHLSQQLTIQKDGEDIILEPSKGFVKGTRLGPFTFVVGDTLSILLGEDQFDVSLQGEMTIDQVIDAIIVEGVTPEDASGYLKLTSIELDKSIGILPTSASVLLGLPSGLLSYGVPGYIEATTVAEILEGKAARLQVYSGEIVITDANLQMPFEPEFLGNLTLRIPGKIGTWLVDITTGDVTNYATTETLENFTGAGQLYSERVSLPRGSVVTQEEVFGFQNRTLRDLLTISDATGVILPNLISVGDSLTHDTSIGAYSFSTESEIGSLETSRVRLATPIEDDGFARAAIWPRSILEWVKITESLEKYKTPFPDKRDLPKSPSDKTKYLNSVLAYRNTLLEMTSAAGLYDLGLQKKYAQNMIRSFTALLKENGFDRAFSLLMSGKLKEFFQLSEANARFIGTLRIMTSNL